MDWLHMVVTTLLTDFIWDLDCYMQLPVKFTLFPRRVVQSTKWWCRVNTPFSPVNVTVCPVLAIICSPGSLFCSSKASLHHYSERSFCGSAKRSHSCTQISWRQPRLGRLSPPLRWPLVLPPAPFLWLWGYMVNRIGEDHLERGMATQPHPESIRPFGSHPVSPNPVLILQQAEGSAITSMAFSLR